MTSDPVITDPKTVGLYTDLGDPFESIAVGDWIATEAGARYLVVESRRVQSTRHAQRNRWRTRCLRLERGCEVPPDVHCIWMRWYRR